MSSSRRLQARLHFQMEFLKLMWWTDAAAVPDVCTDVFHHVDFSHFYIVLKVRVRAPRIGRAC